MKRGTGLEQGLAIAGMVLWPIWTSINLLPPPDYPFLALGIGLSILSVVEFRRWQANKVALRISGRGGKKAYPSTAWFGVGAIPAVVLAAIVSGAMYGISETGSEKAAAWFIGVIAWIAGGSITARLLVRQAERRDGVTTSREPISPSQPPLAHVPAEDRPRYEALVTKRDVSGLSDAEAGELGRMMAQAQE